MDFEKLKEFVERELRWTKPTDTKAEVEVALHITFGAVQFYMNCNPDQWDEVNEWWMVQREKFYELKRNAPEKKDWKKGLTKS